MKSARSISVPSAGLWGVAQVMGVLLTLVLVGALWMYPDPTLNLLWNAVIPLLPAAFLVSPAIWRNTCPLATLNMMGGGRRTLKAAQMPWAGAAGIALLLLLVPARRFAFNTDGHILAATIVAVAVLAVVAGFFFSAKAGFCNSICPVLPVERLYGQAPMMSVGNPRCGNCVGCAPSGCIDLVPFSAASQTLGRSAQSWRWLLTPWGAFAASFPGFMIGYFALEDGPLSQALAVYGTIAMWMAISYGVIMAIVLTRWIPTHGMIRFLGATALTLYYWLGAPALATAWNLPDGFTLGVRGAVVLLVSVWMLRTRGARSPRRSVTSAA